MIGLATHIGVLLPIGLRSLRGKVKILRIMTSQSNNSAASDETFFATVKPPTHFQDSLNTIDSFLLHHENGSYPVVLVTSGGTIVPLERQMVRFLDNFSAGSRGAISAE